MEAAITEITATEALRLIKLEVAIERGQKSFIEVGEALMEIRERRLYRAESDSFDAYCAKRWGFTARRANQLISASEVAVEIEQESTKSGNHGSHLKEIASNERQARELAKVPDEQRVKVAKEAVKSAPKDDEGKPKVTAAVIKQAAEKVAAGVDAVKALAREVREDKKTEDEKPAEDETGEKITGKKCVAAFALRNRGMELRQKLIALKKDVLAYANELGGHYDAQEIGRRLGECVTWMGDSLPHAQCTKCDGAGCAACAKTGWQSKYRWNTIVANEDKK